MSFNRVVPLWMILVSLVRSKQPHYRGITTRVPLLEHKQLLVQRQTIISIHAAQSSVRDLYSYTHTMSSYTHPLSSHNTHATLSSPTLPRGFCKYRKITLLTNVAMTCGAAIATLWIPNTTPA